MKLGEIAKQLFINKIPGLRQKQEEEALRYQQFADKASVAEAAGMIPPDMADKRGVSNFLGQQPELGTLDKIKNFISQRSPVGNPFQKELSPVPDNGTNYNIGQAVPTAAPTPTMTPDEQSIWDINKGRIPKITKGETLGAIDENIRMPSLTPTPTPVPNVTPLPPNPTATMLAKYEIPDPVYYGIRDAEGGNIGDFNPMNLGAFDSNPQNAYDYDSEEAGVEAFAREIATNPRYAKAYAARNNPKKMIIEIMKAGYAGDPKTWKERSIKSGGAGQTYNSWADFVQDTPGWQSNYDE